MNKLYTGNFDDLKLSADRPEVKAWTNMIAMKQIPENIKEAERLKELETTAKEQKDVKKIFGKRIVELEEGGTKFGSMKGSRRDENSRSMTTS